MKLLVCQNRCDRMVLALAFESQECACRSTGGRYNADGDTVTVWGDGILLGLSNRAFFAALAGETHGSVWRYDEFNGKVTRTSRSTP